MPIIKVETSGAGRVIINGNKYPKGSFDVLKKGASGILLTRFRHPLFQEDYTNFRNEADESFASRDLALAYLNGCFGVSGGGIASSDVSNVVVTTQEAFDALDPKVSTTLYLIPEA